jgi:hypothetical protein
MVLILKCKTLWGNVFMLQDQWSTRTSWLLRGSEFCTISPYDPRVNPDYVDESLAELLSLGTELYSRGCDLNQSLLNGYSLIEFRVDVCLVEPMHFRWDLHDTGMWGVIFVPEIETDWFDCGLVDRSRPSDRNGRGYCRDRSCLLKDPSHLTLSSDPSRRRNKTSGTFLS